MPKRVLILCTGNSCRSQMAQVIWRKLGSGNWQAESAGSKPSGYVHRLALAALVEMARNLNPADLEDGARLGIELSLMEFS